MIYSIEELNEKYKGKLARVKQPSPGIYTVSTDFIRFNEIVLFLEFQRTEQFNTLRIPLLTKGKFLVDYCNSSDSQRLTDYFFGAYELI